MAVRTLTHTADGASRGLRIRLIHDMTNVSQIVPAEDGGSCFEALILCGRLGAASVIVHRTSRR